MSSGGLPPEVVPTVDVHAHALVPSAEALLAGQPGWADQRERDGRWFGKAATQVNRGQISRLGPMLTDVDLRIEAMDHARIDIQVVSPMPLQHAWADEPLAREFASATNEGIASLVRRHPDRLTGLGAVALQHPKVAVEQLDEVVGLGLRGVQVGTMAGGVELDHPSLGDFWARVEEVNALVIVHPWGCTLGERLADYYLANTVGNPVETTVALSRVIYSGLLDRHPRLQLCAVHGGGYLPTYLGRSDHAWQVRPDAHGCAEPPSHYLRRLWFDSLVYEPSGLRALVDAVGVDRVLLGSDYPFDMGVRDPVDRLDAAGLPSEAAAAISGGNAAVLLATTSTGAPA